MPSLFQNFHCRISLSLSLFLAHPLTLSPDTPYVGHHNFEASHPCKCFAYMKCGMHKACILARSILFSRVGFAWLFLLITMKDLHGARCVLSPSLVLSSSLFRTGETHAVEHRQRKSEAPARPTGCRLVYSDMTWTSIESLACAEFNSH